MASNVVKHQKKAVIQNLAAPLTPLCGTPVGNHWSTTMNNERKRPSCIIFHNSFFDFFQHTVSESFQTHLEEEYRVRGGCPSDWVWLTPSQSGSLVPLYHQEMLHYHLSPSYERQVSPLPYNLFILLLCDNLILLI